MIRSQFSSLRAHRRQRINRATKETLLTWRNATANNLQVGIERIERQVNQKLRRISDHHATHRSDWAYAGCDFAGDLLEVVQSIFRSALGKLQDSRQVKQLLTKVVDHVTDRVHDSLAAIELGRKSIAGGEKNQQIFAVVAKHFWRF